MTQLLDDLRAARALISTPEKWTKGIGARDVNGSCVTSDSKSAHSFCLDGACFRTTRGVAQVARYETLSAAIQAQLSGVQGRTFWCWNDMSTTQHEDVLAVIDRAIAAEERRRDRE